MGRRATEKPCKPEVGHTNHNLIKSGHKNAQDLLHYTSVWKQMVPQFLKILYPTPIFDFSVFRGRPVLQK